MKNKILQFVGIALVVAGVIAFVNLGKSSDPVTLGVISGMTGEYGEIGQTYVNGIMLAYDQYLENGHGPEVKIFVEDDAFSSKTGLSAFKKLVEFNKIDALMNMTTPTIEVIYDDVVDLNLPVIQLGVQSREPKNDSVFQITGDGVPQKEALGSFVRKNKSGETTIVYQNIPAILNFVDSFKKGFGEGITELAISPDESDFRNIATKALGYKPDTIVVIMFPEQGARFTKEILNQSSDSVHFIYDSQMQTGFSDYQRILGDLSVIDGSIVEYIVENKDEDFVEDYKAKYGTDPGLGADWGFDSFNLLLDNYDSNKSSWLENIQETNIQGVSGKLFFDQRGVRQIETEIRKIKNGELTEL